MVKDETSPPKPKGNNRDLGNLMSQANANNKLSDELPDDDKKASENMQKFL
jgi:hypothetical protein